jgi:hypothetical protein
MIGMFLTSTLYHAIQHRGAKRILRILDHSVIYLFIAGTYTPFCLTALKGAWGWSLFAVEWSLAALGITLYILDNKALKKIEVAAYILMGWVIVVGFVVLLIASTSSSSLLLCIVYPVEISCVRAVSGVRVSPFIGVSSSFVSCVGVFLEVIITAQVTNNEEINNIISKVANIIVLREL